MSGMPREVISLAQKLISFDTVNPPGRELEAMKFCASWLQEAGFDCAIQPQSEGRGNLVATRAGGHGPALCFSGHLDTVMLGGTPWTRPPFGGSVGGDRLYGRGASDMKGAIAAFMIACSATRSDDPGIAIVLTAGEETGCEGARRLADAGLLPRAAAMIVGEPSDNHPLAGHKGAYWLRLTGHGVSAHGAMPERGVNAILGCISKLDRIAELDLGDEHPVMGRTTCNLSTIKGGASVNAVPDLCEFTLDFRSNRRIDHLEIYRRIERFFGPGIDIDVLLDLPAVWTEPDRGRFADMVQAVSDVTGLKYRPEVAQYFTDAAILQPAMQDLPVMILGPGSPDQSHRTDEYVLISQLQEATKIYSSIIDCFSRQLTAGALG
jgi:succinyl-diaminopimelate desuccinylase